MQFVFQLTTSRGGRRYKSTSLRRSSIVFQLTTSQGGRHLLAVALKMSALYFNSRPRKEVDRMYFFEKKTYEHFNSRPREEVDSLISSLLLRYISISTHDLTRRSTLWTNPKRLNNITISTHDLTRRSTVKNALHWFSFHISTHDLTRRSTSGKVT